MTKENNLELEIENLKKQNDEYLNGWKRAKADYLNLKKEMESQNKQIKDWLSKVFLMPLLAVLDGFEKAFISVPANLASDNWFLGISGIKRQFEDYLKAQGVEEIKSLGDIFDPLKHEAVGSVEGGESNVISEVVQKGYLLNEEVLRPAKVKVYK